MKGLRAPVEQAARHERTTGQAFHRPATTWSRLAEQAWSGRPLHQSRDNGVQSITGNEQFRKLLGATVAEPIVRMNIARDTRTFMQRAITEQLPPHQVARTLQSMRNLLSSQSNLMSQSDRIKIVAAFMHMAADPSDTSQGYHSTCTVTSLQNRTMTLYPAVAAEMISQVANTGNWRAPDGKVIRCDSQSLQPGEEERGPKSPYTRNTATQLFNIVTLNDMGQRLNPPLRYIQRPQTATSTGEYWADMSGRIVAPFRGLAKMDQLAVLQLRLNFGENTALVHRDDEDESVSLKFANRKELASLLESLHQSHKLPALLQVNTHKSVFGFAGPYGWNHVVSVDAFDPSTGQGRIFNPWGKRSRSGRPQNLWLPLDVLYDTTVV